MKVFFVILWGLMMLTTNSSLASELKIKVSNIDVNRGGNIIVMIFGENGFPKIHEKAFFIRTQSAQQEIMEFKFNLVLEELAVKVLHDENEDGKVTKNWTGIYPKEGLGFSNNQKIGLTGPPKYKYSKLLREQFKDGLNISIIYP